MDKSILNKSRERIEEKIEEVVLYEDQVNFFNIFIFMKNFIFKNKVELNNNKALLYYQ